MEIGGCIVSYCDSQERYVFANFIKGSLKYSLLLQESVLKKHVGCIKRTDVSRKLLNEGLLD